MSTTEENISLERSNKVDVYTQENINHYYNNKSHIENRLRQLEKEMSIEQIFQLHDAANVTVGLMLSVATRKQKWLILPASLSLCKVFKPQQACVWELHYYASMVLEPRQILIKKSML